uniref:Putative secreted protein n=1 Tax=Anopheles marajoara TaxID=58244 RepID=A0A2M4C6I0_9DIPT
MMGQRLPVSVASLATANARSPYEIARCLATSTSSPRSCTKRIYMVGVQPWAPSIQSPSVTQPRSGFRLHALMAASSVCSAIARYVVHLPPAIVTSFESLTCTIWLRARDCVSSLLGSDTSGRMPLQADSTSPRRTSTSLFR